MSVLTLVCSCGMKLKTPGAVPGRVGKCPRCGSLLIVPEPGKPETPLAPTPARRETFVGARGKKAPAPSPIRKRSDGLVTPPAHPEVRLVDSLTYPLWNASGIALLIFMPPLLVLATSPLFAILPMLSSGMAVALIGLVWSVPQLLLLSLVVGYTLLCLAQVLTTSASGEVLVPRSPGWDLSEIGRTLARWFWALVVGAVVGGMPPLLYWIWCGEVDWFDRIVLVDLIVPGLAYAQMALLAALVRDTPLAANPVTVIRAIVRVGWGYLIPCLFTGSCLLVLGSWFMAILQIRDGLAQLSAYYAFWVAMLYAGMVILRRLGLFCFRNAVVLDWFPDRTTRGG